MNTNNKRVIKRFCANKGAVFSLLLLILFVITALIAPWLSPFSPHEVFDGSYRLPPFWLEGSDPRFLFGTDDIGRDLLSRLIFGAQVSLGVGFMVVTLTLAVGCILGILAGYFGGWWDIIISRIIDMIMSLPSILLAIVVVAVLGPNLINAIIAVSVVALPNFVRIVRAAILAEKQKTYVDASRGFGANHFRISVRNIFPNCLAPILVQASLGFSDGILNVAALGFLGLGAQAPTAEWGTMLSDARSYIESAWWVVTLPGLCILIVVLAFNLFGDGLRDALDPKL